MCEQIDQGNISATSDLKLQNAVFEFFESAMLDEQTRLDYESHLYAKGLATKVYRRKVGETDSIGPEDRESLIKEVLTTSYEVVDAFLAQGPAGIEFVRLVSMLRSPVTLALLSELVSEELVCETDVHDNCIIEDVGVESATNFWLDAEMRFCKTLGDRLKRKQSLED